MENKCPLCELSDYIEVGVPDIGAKAQKIIKNNFKVVQCNNCNFYFLEPPVNFSKEEWEYLYSEGYFAQPTKWHLKQRESDRKKRFDTLQQYATIEVNKFLDIGCGEGYTLAEASGRGWIPYGLDIYDNRIEEIKSNNNYFIKGDLFSSSFPDNYFDIIYLDSVLEHVPNPMQYLFEVNRILKKGGLVYIGVPNEDSLLNDFRKFIFKIKGGGISEKLIPFKSPYHIGGFNSDSLNYIVGKSNFKILSKRNFACRLEFLKYPFLSEPYLNSLFLLPVFLLAIPLKKEVYFELYLEKA